MIRYGSLMSQALQCTQLAALICRRRPPLPSSTISYTPAGQNRSQGLPYSRVQRPAQMLVSATFRCTGWFSSCALPAKNTNETRSRGGSVRSTHWRSGEENASSFCNRDQSALFFSVQGDLPAVSNSHAELTRPSHMPRLNAGLKLRTRLSSWPPSEPRHLASKPAPEPVCAICSPASTPERIAWCTPLILAKFSVPPASPMRIAPGISSVGVDCQPPAATVRAPAETISPPCSSAFTLGWFLYCWNASNGCSRGSS